MKTSHSSSNVPSTSNTSLPHDASFNALEFNTLYTVSSLSGPSSSQINDINYQLSSKAPTSSSSTSGTFPAYSMLPSEAVSTGQNYVLDSSTSLYVPIISNSGSNSWRSSNPDNSTPTTENMYSPPPLTPNQLIQQELQQLSFSLPSSPTPSPSYLNTASVSPYLPYSMLMTHPSLTISPETPILNINNTHLLQGHHEFQFSPIDMTPTVHTISDSVEFFSPSTNYYPKLSATNHVTPILIPASKVASLDSGVGVSPAVQDGMHSIPLSISETPILDSHSFISEMPLEDYNATDLYYAQYDYSAELTPGPQNIYRQYHASGSAESPMSVTLVAAPSITSPIL
jgi:hypothetical protein